MAENSSFIKIVGAEVTVVDILEENKQYALELAAPISS